jgi:hypothetical protein
MAKSRSWFSHADGEVLIRAPAHTPSAVGECEPVGRSRLWGSEAADGRAGEEAD